MKKNKLKKLRTKFRNDVFQRDKNLCVICQAAAVDAHHITDRHEMPNGGYVKENGISLCALDHTRAEMFHRSEKETWFQDAHPDDLYRLIGSSHDLALKKSEALSEGV